MTVEATPNHDRRVPAGPAGCRRDPDLARGAIPRHPGARRPRTPPQPGFGRQGRRPRRRAGSRPTTSTSSTDPSPSKTRTSPPPSTACSPSTRPPHVSAYALTVEPGTPLAADPARHPDDDTEADRYELVDEILGAAGLDCYEISNWARPGHECHHNLACWRGADYLGFGCAAHSHVAGHRFANVASPERYIDRVRDGLPAVAMSERLDPAARQAREPAARAAHPRRRPRGGAAGLGRARRPRRAPAGARRAHPARPAARQRGGDPPAAAAGSRPRAGRRGRPAGGRTCCWRIT